MADPQWVLAREAINSEADDVEVPHERINRSFAKRSFAPMGPGGVRQSIFTLVQTAIGGGVLTIAYMMRLVGLAGGVFLLLNASLIAVFSMDILMRAAVKKEASTFGELLAACFGARVQVLLDLALVFYGMGSMIAYFIFLGDFLPAIVSAFSGGAIQENGTLRTMCILATLAPIVPLSFPKDLSALRYVAPMGIIALLYTAVVVLAKAPGLHSAHLKQSEFGTIELLNVDWNVFEAYSVSVFAFNCHMNVCPVAAELQSPTSRRSSKVAFRVVVVQVVFYLIIALGGYFSFMVGTTQDLLQSYASSDSFCLVARVLLSCALMVGIPTNNNPTVRAFFGLIDSCSGTPEADVPARFYPLNREGLRHFVAMCTLGIEVLVAIVVPDVAIVLGYLGSTVGTLMMMVVPALVMQATLKDQYPVITRQLIVSFLTMCALVSAMAIVVLTLQNLGMLEKA
eukprot:CAMPEP_0194505688 /NCGR_PEP_ID=MMETSP0253-20130528/32970_1 /TAXON_ID=2966 /ORGANISM="Noctiluca scintillans" /LENGTH=454 /DNA_ID=CAMNT_0039348289 /DNA_START=45 /DNA_END=1405 /DNA_ORIENTATION=+